MKIAIIHFRVGLTDGVSLQIDERTQALKKLGHSVCYIADNESPIADLLIPYFDYKNHPEIVSLQKSAFGMNDSVFAKEEYHRIAQKILETIEEFWQKERFEFVFVHNLFSLPVCLPGTAAVYSFLKNHPDVGANTIHHDFYWDPPRVHTYRTDKHEIQNLLMNQFPPVLPNLNHTVISTWEQNELMKRRSIQANVMTDTFNFDQPLWQKNLSNKDFLHDIGLSGEETIFLTASRIRPRKGIEMAIDLTAEYGKKGGKTVLLLPGDYKHEEQGYVERLKKRALEKGADVRWIQSFVGSEEEKKEGKRKYSLWDTYVYADAIVYPSLWEGWGNQFIEAVFAKKPIVVFEYPVFQTDIAPAGFETISLGSECIYQDGLAAVSQKMLDDASMGLKLLLSDPERLKQMTASNWNIGKKHFNTDDQLLHHLTSLLRVFKEK